MDKFNVFGNADDIYCIIKYYLSDNVYKKRPFKCTLVHLWPIFKDFMLTGVVLILRGNFQFFNVLYQYSWKFYYIYRLNKELEEKHKLP